MSIFKIFSSDLAVDLGTSNIIVYDSKQGVVLHESSCVALDIRNGEVVAIGNKAKDMIGKTPDNISIVRPLEDGVISDFDITKILLKYCFDKVLPSFKIFQPKVVITAPVNVTDIELRAIEDACIYSGARDVYIIESAVAVAIGAGFDVISGKGNFIVNIGAGSTEIAIVNLNGIVISKNLGFGGDKFDYDIIDFIENKYSLIIGKNTAQDLREQLSCLDNSRLSDSKEISGRDLVTGMPKNMRISSKDIYDAIIDNYNEIVDSIKFVLEKTPPELSRDILNNGVFLTGGSSIVKYIDTFIENQIGIKVTKSENPLEDCVIGAGTVVKNLKKYLNFGKLDVVL